MKLYHGTSKLSGEDIIRDGVDMRKSTKGYFGAGFYTTPDFSLAKASYADFSDDEGCILMLTIRENARILDLRKPEDWVLFSQCRVKGQPADEMYYVDRFDLHMVEIGIDGITDNSFEGTVIYNPDIIVSIAIQTEKEN